MRQELLPDTEDLPADEWKRRTLVEMQLIHQTPRFDDGDPGPGLISDDEGDEDGEDSDGDFAGDGGSGGMDMGAG